MEELLTRIFELPIPAQEEEEEERILGDVAAESSPTRLYKQLDMKASPIPELG